MSQERSDGGIGASCREGSSLSPGRPVLRRKNGQRRWSLAFYKTEGALKNARPDVGSGASRHLVSPPSDGVTATKIQWLVIIVSC